MREAIGIVALGGWLVACAPDRFIPDAAAPDAGGAALVGLPCDVATVFANRCLSCHSDPPAGGVPISLASYELLQRASVSDPARTAAEVALARMQDPSRPMPPSGRVPAAELDAVAAWVNAGAPRVTCGETIDVPDAGPGLPDTPPGCMTGTFWTGGEDGGPTMHPGRPCLACHLENRGADDDMPHQIAGTVYAGLREDDECNGVEGAVVELTDANGHVHRFTTNAAGNFFASPAAATVVMPFTARVLLGDRVRAMATPQDTGDCNGCHTATGAEEAPGRIVAP